MKASEAKMSDQNILKGFGLVLSWTAFLAVWRRLGHRPSCMEKIDLTVNVIQCEQPSVLFMGSQPAGFVHKTCEFFKHPSHKGH